jgi:hypothetical protein
MRRAARTDGNHEAITEAFRAAGCSVQSLAAVGCGCPDLLCAINGYTFLVEIKDCAQAPSKRRLTPMQYEWHASWHGKVHLVETVDAALFIAGQYRHRKAA